jgi:DNA-binding IclR family transcriptional regulator
LVTEFAIVDGRAAEPAVRKQGVAGNVPDAHPPHALVQAGGVAAGDGVEHEQRLAAVARSGFGGAHERRPQALAARAAIYQHLREIGAMGLVLGLVEHQLHGAAHACCVFGDEQRAVARGHVRCDAPPERDSPLARERLHETDGGAAVDAIDQDAGKPVNVRVIHRAQPSHRPGCGHRR